MPNPNELPNGMMPSRISDFGNDSTSNPYLNKSAPSSNAAPQNPSSPPPIPTLHGSTPQENNAIQYAQHQGNSVSGEGLSSPEYHSAQYNAYMKGLVASGYLPTEKNTVQKVPTEYYTKGYIGPSGDVVDLGAILNDQQVRQTTVTVSNIAKQSIDISPIPGPQTPQSKGLNLGQAALSGQETFKPIFKQGSVVTSIGNQIQIETPVKQIRQQSDNYLNTPEGKDALLNYAKQNSQNNLIAFDNKLIDYHNNLIKEQDQSIALGNALADLSNQQITAKNQSIALGNGLIDLSNQQIAQRNQLILQQNTMNAANNGIDKLANQDTIQKNQLITQQNINAAVDNAINKLTVKTFIDNAVKSGVKSFDILAPSKIGGALGSQGVKVGTTTPDKAMSDLAKFQSKGINVSLSYQPVAKQATGPFDEIKNIIKSSPFGEFAKGAFGGAEAVNAKSPAVTPFAGGIDSKNVLSNIVSFGTKTYQSPTKDNGFFSPQLLTKNPQYVAGGIVGAVGVGALTLGAPGAGKVVNVASDLIKTGLGKSVVSDIAKGLSVGEKSTPGQLQKISQNLFEYSKGTEGRTITPTTKIQKAIDIFRLPTSKIVPGFGKVATQEGKVGAIESKIPSQVKIPKAQGEAEIPLAFIQPKGITAIIPKVANDIKETSVLIKNVNPELQSRLGLKPVENMPGFSSGKLTPESRLILRQAESQGLVTKEITAFQYPTTDVKKAPSVYAAITKQPSLIEGGKLPDITRPDVLGVYRTESKGFESPKGKVSYQGEPYGSRGLSKYLSGFSDISFKPVINPISGELETIRPFEPEVKPTRKTKSTTPFSMEGTSQSKVGAGQSGKATSLINEKTENLFKDFFKGEVQKEKNIGDYLGFTPRTKGRTSTTQESEIIAYPPGTKSELIRNHGVLLSNDVQQLFTQKQSQANKSSTLFKISSKQEQRQREKLVSFNISGQKEMQQYRQKLGISLGNLLEHKQTSDLMTRTLQSTIPIQKGKTKQSQSFVQSQLPKTLQLTKLLEQQKQIPIPNIPDRPFVFSPGGNYRRLYGMFPSWAFEKKKLRKVFDVTGESENIFIKYLPESSGHPFLTASTNPKIFKIAEDYDKHIQSIVFGTGKKRRKQE